MVVFEQPALLWWPVRPTDGSPVGPRGQQGLLTTRDIYAQFRNQWHSARLYKFLNLQVKMTVRRVLLSQSAAFWNNKVPLYMSQPYIQMCRLVKSTMSQGRIQNSMGQSTTPQVREREAATKRKQNTNMAEPIPEIKKLITTNWQKLLNGTNKKIGHFSFKLLNLCLKVTLTAQNSSCQEDFCLVVKK